MTSSGRDQRRKGEKSGNKINFWGGLNGGKVGRKREGFILSLENWDERRHQGVFRVKGRAAKEANSAR